MVLMKNVDRTEAIEAVRHLSDLLDKNSPDSQTAAYTREYLGILERNKNKVTMAFYGQLRYFIMTVRSYHGGERLPFAEETQAAWYHVLNDRNELGVLHGMPFL